MLLTRDEVAAAFETYDDSDRSKFELVENPPSPRSDLSGLLILDRILSRPGRRSAGRIISSAGHDQIWFDVDLGDLVGRATDADVLLLVQCGIHWDDDVGSLTMAI